MSSFGALAPHEEDYTQLYMEYQPSTAVSLLGSAHLPQYPEQSEAAASMITSSSSALDTKDVLHGAYDLHNRAHHEAIVGRASKVLSMRPCCMCNESDLCQTHIFMCTVNTAYARTYTQEHTYMQT